VVILGEPGAGKSGAGILLLRDALAHRATATPRDRARVPVLVTPEGWDPTAAPFAEWLAAYLARRYALLRAPEYGGDATMRLIEGGHLAVILDGLDEMPEALRPVALRALDDRSPSGWSC
jgi:predicted NACHT family NTPase